MRLLSVLLFVAISAAYAQTPLNEDLIAGKFSGTFQTPSRTLGVALDCDSTSECRLDFNSRKGNKLKSVRSIAKFDFASNALECARKRDTSRISNPEVLAEQSKLEPMLTSGAKLERCWDLNDPTPTYTLACTVDVPKFRQEVLYLFVAAPESRGEGACSYMIFALNRDRG